MKKTFTFSFLVLLFSFIGYSELKIGLPESAKQVSSILSESFYYRESPNVITFSKHFQAKGKATKNW